MAREGLMFRDAYSVSAVCTPSRASLMTGVHPMVHQTTCVQNSLPWNLPQMAELFQRAGYFTAACGHHEMRRGLGRGWHEQIDQNAAGRYHDSWSEWMSLGRRDVAWSSGSVPRPAEEGNSALMTDWMLTMVDTAARTGAPCFLHLALNDPHPPYFVPPPYDGLVDPDTVELPPAAKADFRPAWQRKALHECRSNEASAPDIRNVIATYYGMIAYANDQMQRIFDAFDRHGMMENTWFILTSDHGDYTGEKGLFNKSESLYECLLHVPLIIRPPAHLRAPRGSVVEGLVELTDLMPTLLGLAGIPVPEYVQGHDLIDWVRNGAEQPLRDFAFAQVGDYHGHLKTTWPGGMPASGRHPSLLQGARSLEFSYVCDPDYGDEAYDLRSDPWELCNLLQAPGTTPPKEILELRVATEQWEAECLNLRNALKILPGDRGFTDETQHASQKASPGSLS